MFYNYDTIMQMPERYRANFVNALSGFKAANLIGTQSSDGVDNLAIVSSVFHVGAHPPLLGMIMRPHTVVRDTLENIKHTGVYTINHVNENMVTQSHQTSARYPAEQSEFEAVGLSPERVEGCLAPFVAQSHIKLWMTVESIQLIELNQTELVIGKINAVITSEDYASKDGYVDIEKAQTIAVSGLDSYHQTSRMCRLPYAKVNTD